MELIKFDRFWNKTTKNDQTGCYEWKAQLSHNGYGIFSYKLKHERAHRVSYMLHIGKIPEGLLVCHHCDNPCCVNPNHLFLGTQLDNMRDMIKKGRKRTKSYINTHCKYGHFKVLNIKGKMICKECIKQASMRRYNKKKM